MIHFLFGLYYVFLTVLLLLGYCLVVPAIFWLLNWFWRIGRLLCTPMRWRFWRKDIGLPINRARLRFVGVMALAVVVFCFSLYGKELIKWTGKGTAHHEAKAYFAAGQPLFAVRTILTRQFHPRYRPLAPFHPESRLLAPFQKLQERIYERGIRFLPEDDAERAAWFNVWFLYHYTTKFIEPKGTDWFGPSSPGMIALLDKVWFCLEALGTLPMADKKMSFTHYLKTYPVLATYYTKYKWFYIDGTEAPGRELAQSELHTQRARLMVEWLEKLKKEWSNSSDMKDYLQRNQNVSALRDWGVISELMLLIQGDILRGEFDCSSKTVDLYISTRGHFINSREYIHAAYRLKGVNLHRWVTNKWQSRVTKYILKKYCSAFVAGESIESDADIISLYSDEIEILDKEKKNGY